MTYPSDPQPPQYPTGAPYPPQPAPYGAAPQPFYPQYPPARPPKTKMSRNNKIVVGIVAVVIAIIGVSAGVGGLNGTVPSVVNDSAAGDVTIDSCSSSDGLLTAVVTVKNSTRTVEQYAVTVAFVDSAGNQLGTGNAFVQDLQPGQSTTQKAVGFGDGQPSSCSVTSVSRF